MPRFNFIAALLVPALIISSLSFSQKTTGKKYKLDSYGMVVLGKHKFEYSERKVDTIKIVDPQTKEAIMKIVKIDPRPLKVDGKLITDETVKFKGGGSAEEYFLGKIKNEISKLEDGYYRLDVYNIIVDDKGKICAFTYGGIHGKRTEKGGFAENPITIPAALEDIIFEKIGDELAAFPNWEPAVLNNKPVVGEASVIKAMGLYKITAHKIAYFKNGGWQGM